MSKAGKLRVPEYLGHIQEAIKRIHLYVENMAEKNGVPYLHHAQHEKTEENLTCVRLKPCVLTAKTSAA